MVTKITVMKKLKEVIDPELGISVVDLGLIYGVSIKGNNVAVNMTFTTPACPLGAYLIEQVKEKAASMSGVETVQVNLVWDPPWTHERISKKVRNLF